MAIYKMNSEGGYLDPIRETSFAQENIKEDPDLRYTLRAEPEAIEEGLFILSEEFSGHWQGSGRSIDLLGLDSKGRLVVIELKRTATGDHAELQAIRYAAMVSILTSERIIEAHQEYMGKWGIEGDAAERIQQHLAETEFEDIYTESPRIILVSEGFSRELTTSVLWLNDNGLDITCIQLQPFRNGKELLIESSQVIPVPGSEALLVQAQSKREEAKRQRAERGTRVSGGDAFKERIEAAPEEFWTDLKRLYEWAAKLEEQNLVKLSTRLGSITTLSVAVPGESALVAFRFQSNDAQIGFQADKFRDLAPTSMPIVGKVSGISLKDIKTATRKNLSTLSDVLEELLDALTEAYREANGLPVGEEDEES